MEDIVSELIISISGLRGIVGQSLGAGEAVAYGMAFGTFLVRGKASGGRPRVCVGRDSRPSGSMVCAAVSAGLMAVGCDTVDLGIVTTPGVALMGRHLSCDGAVVITASHNPVIWNGIKLLSSDGIAFSADKAKEIRQFYYEKKFDVKEAMGAGQACRNDQAHAVHIDAALKLCDKKLIAAKKFKVVVDSINGAGCEVTARLLAELGCKVVHINNVPDGCFAHTPEPTAENLAGLGPEVVKHKAMLGFAQDPDADRLAIVDEKGRYIGEEYSLALAVKYMLGKKKGTVAANLSTSRMVDDLAAEAGCKVIRTPVGEAHVAHAMLDNNCVIGGEGNGGVIDLRVVPVRDSLVGMVLVLQLLAETGKTVSQLVNEIPSYHMIKTKIPCRMEQVGVAIEAVKRHFEATGAQIDVRDGIRVDLPDGWVQLRGSNTEPIMRIMAESRSAQKAEELVAEVRKLLGVLG